MISDLKTKTSGRIRLRFVCKVNPSKAGISSRSPYTEVSFIPMEAVGEFGSLSLTQTKTIEEVSTGYTYFENDDVIVAKITPCFENGKGALAQELENGIGFGTTELHVLRPYSGLVDGKFIYYLTVSHAFRKKGEATMYGAGGQKRVAEDFIKDFRTVLPPLTIQQAISRFLDRETARIDTLIEKKKRQIELLQEKRAALITRAVTKGLDPNARMKDSGVEWIGEIPEGWEVKKLRYIGSCQNGISKGGEYFGSGFPFLSYGDVYKNEELPKKPDGLVESTQHERGAYSVEEGDVFFTRTSETIEEIGIASTCMETVPDAVFAGFLIRVRPQKNVLVKEYSKYYFRANILRFFFVKETNLVTRASLSQDLLKNLPVLLPPKEEMRRIGEFLEAENSKMNMIECKIKDSLSLLQEYRSSLITAAVSGQIDVSAYEKEGVA